MPGSVQPRQYCMCLTKSNVHVIQDSAILFQAAFSRYLLSSSRISGIFPGKRAQQPVVDCQIHPRTGTLLLTLRHTRITTHLAVRLPWTTTSLWRPVSERWLSLLPPPSSVLAVGVCKLWNVIIAHMAD